MNMRNISRNLLWMETQHSLVFLHPQPILAGRNFQIDTIVCPKREAAHLHQLPTEENVDLWKTVQQCTHLLQNQYPPSSFTIETKDGVHQQLFVNIIPRFENDLEYRDQVYPLLQNSVSVLDNVSLHMEALALKK